MLKPIPQENPEEIRKNTAKKAKRFFARGPGAGASAGEIQNADQSGQKPDLPEEFEAGLFVERDSCQANPVLSAEKKFMLNMHRKMQADEKKDRNLIKSVCLRMINFVRKNGRASKQEIGEMIHGLQRSVLSLERQRRRIYMKERKKKKK